MLVVIGIAIGLAVGAGLAFLSLYAFAGSRLAAARRTRQLLVTAVLGVPPDHDLVDDGLPSTDDVPF